MVTATIVHLGSSRAPWLTKRSVLGVQLVRSSWNSVIRGRHRGDIVLVNRFSKHLAVICAATAVLALALPTQSTVTVAGTSTSPDICDFFPYWPGCP